MRASVAPRPLEPPHRPGLAARPARSPSMPLLTCARAKAAAPNNLAPVQGSIEAHRRYLLALRDACAPDPVIHAHQLAALDAELDLASGDDLDAYLEASGNLFELTRAASLDRLAGQARTGVATGDPWRARAAAVEYAAAVDATGHGDWAEHTAAGADRAAAITAAGADATAAFTRL